MLSKGSKFCNRRLNFTGGRSDTFFAGREGPIISFYYASESDLNEFSMDMSMSNVTVICVANTDQRSNLNYTERI